MGICGDIPLHHSMMKLDVASPLSFYLVTRNVCLLAADRIDGAIAHGMNLQKVVCEDFSSCISDVSQMKDLVGRVK